jgi:hypothetical protein
VQDPIVKSVQLAHFAVNKRQQLDVRVKMQRLRLNDHDAIFLEMKK